MLTESQRAQVRSLVAIMSSYGETMKLKHIGIALRAYCAVHGLPYDEVLKETAKLRLEMVELEGNKRSEPSPESPTYDLAQPGDPDYLKKL